MRADTDRLESARHSQDHGVYCWSDTKEDIEIKAKPEGIWTLAYDYVKGPALIQIEADDGEWQYASGKKCKADGDLTSMLSSQETMLASAPVGALIAKIGGSTAGIADGRLFVAGKRYLLQIDQDTGGLIFLTMNDQLSGMQNNDGSIKVTISIKPVTNVPASPAVSAVPAVQPSTSSSSTPAIGAAARTK